MEENHIKDENLSDDEGKEPTNEEKLFLEAPFKVEYGITESDDEEDANGGSSHLDANFIIPDDGYKILSHEKNTFKYQECKTHEIDCKSTSNHSKHWQNSFSVNSKQGNYCKISQKEGNSNTCKRLKLSSPDADDDSRVPVSNSPSRTCSIVSCGYSFKRGKKNVSMFAFPRILRNATLDEPNLKRCGIWIRNSGNKSLLQSPSADLCRTRYVCSKHFRVEDTYQNRNHKSRLRVHAIPTEMLGNALSDEEMSVYPVLLPVLPDTLKCCFLSCRPLPGKRISLFAFPRIVRNGVMDIENLERCKIWVKNSGNEALLKVYSSELFQSFHVCSQHFKEEFFHEKDKSSLRGNAVPTEMIGKVLSEEVMSMYPVQHPVASSVLVAEYASETSGQSPNSSKVETLTFKGSRKCCFTSCKNSRRQGKQISFFSFPLVMRNDFLDRDSLERCIFWIKNSGNRGLLTVPIEELNKKFCVCSEHFKTEDMYEKRSSRSLLLPHAIPSEKLGDVLSEEEMAAYASWPRGCVIAITDHDEIQAIPGKWSLKQCGLVTTGTTSDTPVSGVRQYSAGSAGLFKKVNPSLKGNRICCFPLCRNVHGKSVTLFRFPIISEGKACDQGLDRCKLWIRNSGNESLLKVPVKELSQDYYVCSQHFKPEDFMDEKRTRLRQRFAVPTENIVYMLSDEVMSQYYPVQDQNSQVKAILQMDIDKMPDGPTNMVNLEDDIQSHLSED